MGGNVPDVFGWKVYLNINGKAKREEKMREGEVLNIGREGNINCREASRRFFFRVHSNYVFVSGSMILLTRTF